MAHFQLGLTVFFDLTEQDFPWWISAVIPLVLAAAGMIIAIGAPFFGGERWGQKPLRLFGLLLFVFAGLLGVEELWSSWKRYSRLTGDYAAHRFVIVEGIVRNVKRDFGGHGVESFDVGRRSFSYRTSSMDVAFHGEGNAVSMLSGRIVRVFAVGPDIIRIEVVD